MRSVTQEIAVNEYLCDLIWTVPRPPVTLRDVRLMEFPMGTDGVDGLLGRDFLQFGLLEVNGPAKIVTLAF